MTDVEREPGIDDEFTAAQDGEYVAQEGPKDDDERVVDPEEDEAEAEVAFPDEARPVILDDDSVTKND
jgi:hypothetical protein